MTEIVKSVLVEDHEMLNFLPTLFEANMSLAMLFESSVYSIAKNLSHDYESGSWDFYEITGGGGFMALSENSEFSTINNYAQSHSKLNGYEFGLICSLMALSSLSYKYRNNQATLKAIMNIFYPIDNYLRVNYPFETHPTIWEILD